jgi:hypothetical protein
VTPDGPTSMQEGTTMTTTRTQTTGVTELTMRYRRGVEAGDPGTLAALFQPDALVDTHVPNWRFQLLGREAASQRACVFPRPGRFTAFEAEPTASGLLVQFEWRQDDPDVEAVVRQIHAWRLDDGLIAEQIVFCAGVWDRQLQALMAAEAPLVRP